MGRISLIVGLLFLMLSDASAATTVDDGSFGTVYDVFKLWVGGSLGLTVALIIMMGCVLWYLVHFFLLPRKNRIKRLIYRYVYGSSIGRCYWLC